MVEAREKSMGGVDRRLTRLETGRDKTHYLIEKTHGTESWFCWHCAPDTRAHLGSCAEKMVMLEEVAIILVAVGTLSAGLW